MVGEWTTFRLGDVCSKVGSGATPRGGSSVYLREGNVALIRSQNVYNDAFYREGLVYLTEEHADGLANVEVREHDVLLNITGDSVARSCQVAKDILPARVNQHVAIIRPDSSKLSPQFLRYFLVSRSMQAKLLALAGAGATRNALTKSMIENLEITAPENVEEQRAIVHILGSLDDKIELNRRMNETLEALARALFKSWFVDFDPVRAKMEDRQPVGMNDETAALFPDSFEDSPLGEIPKGWSAGSVGDDFDITMGQSPPGETYNEVGEGLPFYQGRRDFKFRYPTLRVYCSAPRRTAQYGDALVSVRAPVGDVNMAENVCCVGRGVAAVRHKTGSRSYTYYAMHSLKSYFKRFESEGTVFGAVNKKGFLTIPFLLPPLALVETFEASIFPLDQRIEVQEKQNLTLAAIRDALLPKLLSGEVRVGEAERIVEERVGGRRTSPAER